MDEIKNDVLCCHIWFAGSCQTCSTVQPESVPSNEDIFTYPRTVIGAVLATPVEYDPA